MAREHVCPWCVVFTVDTYDTAVVRGFQLLYHAKRVHGKTNDEVEEALNPMPVTKIVKITVGPLSDGLIETEVVSG